MQLADGTAAFVTIHPSFLLRIEDEADKEREYRNFVADLRQAAKIVAQEGGLRRLFLFGEASAHERRQRLDHLGRLLPARFDGDRRAGPAASIIRPMIEVPPTTSLPRLTFTSASNFSTVCTNLAEARACKPFLLQISSTRMTGLVRRMTSRVVPPAGSLICRRERGWRW